MACYRWLNWPNFKISFGIAGSAVGTLFLRLLQSGGIDMVSTEFINLTVSKSHEAKE